MPLPLLGAAASVFAGPIGGVLSSVLGGVLGGGGAGEVAGGLLKGPANLFQGIGGAFKKLFGRKRRSRSHRCPQRPQPFKPPFPNPQAQLKTIQDQLGQINDLLSQLSGKLDQMAKQQADAKAQSETAVREAANSQPQAPVQVQTASTPAPAPAETPQTQPPPSEAAPAVAAVATAAVAAVVEAVIPEGLAKIDWMFGEAKRLMLDELTENQLKGQVMYTNASSMFSMISEYGSAASTMTYNMIF